MGSYQTDGAADPAWRPTTKHKHARGDNAIFYIASTGCQWRALPKDFPPMSTVQWYFYAWADTGVLEGMNDLMVAAERVLEGRAAEPTGCSHAKRHFQFLTPFKEF